ncbi:ACP S-malonyltransferase [Streptomyces sp. H10-C2]|uniref:ACP S-malonyltransferase n=1 Tax=unclassified Streptomyces TaxID=2593676 RepID=UPI0024B9BBCD|nr:MULTISPECIES: ACP S-malonyltransferase [unclassified Streptomyces]MDJ0346531.1 ACP S-malonyltransferase [Streptomyces sp. PH10-H1]MDJ0374336.1 ACP S-malonyltransferase [Streptomyces sp. H10-C2]
MDKTAFVFPGQGSQRVGMGLHLIEERPDLLDLYYRPADEILSFPLSATCWEGPAEVLRDTSVTQPAVFLTSLATLEVLRGRGARPDVVAGHSLGEYTAMVAAGVLDWTDALRLVRRRGELMEAVNRDVPGSMAAVIGLGLGTVEEICAEGAAETGQIVEVANDNEPGQAVVSGQADAVAWVRREAERRGAMKVVELAVGAPFHCSLMAGIEEEFAAELSRIPFREPRIPFVSGVTADYVTSARDAVSCLRRQLTGRVRWTDTVRRLAADGAGRFIEVGPGRALGGLCRRTAPEVPVRATNDERRLAQTLAEFASVETAA